MPAQRCSNGKWKWGPRGSCVFDTEEEAKRAGRAIERSKHQANGDDSYTPNDGMVKEVERGLAWLLRLRHRGRSQACWPRHRVRTPSAAVDSYTPTDGMVKEAERGLAWRREFGRGGTSIGLARARDISNRKSLPLDTVKRMKAYFDRHEVDKKGQGWSPGEDGYPSNGRIAWALWGGDPGWTWAKAIVRRAESV